MTTISILDNKIPAVTEAVALYVSLGWGGADEYDNATWEKVLKNSKLITAWDGSKLVGVTRFLTDGYHDTCVTECCVSPDYQGQGIGRSMMDRLIALYGSTSIYINALNGKEGFFEKLDILERTSITAMSRRAA